MPVRRKIVLFIGLYALFLLLSGIGCPFRHYLGISCAGCGMTRACLSAVLPLGLHPTYESVSWSQDLLFRLERMWYYHPAVFVVVPLVIYAFFAKKPMFGSQKREIFVLCAVAVGMFLLWLWRMAQGGEVVYCDLSQGALTAPWLAMIQRVTCP